jgi:hypothetical protein
MEVPMREWWYSKHDWPLFLSTVCFLGGVGFGPAIALLIFIPHDKLFPVYGGTAWPFLWAIALPAGYAAGAARWLLGKGMQSLGRTISRRRPSWFAPPPADPLKLEIWEYEQEADLGDRVVFWGEWVAVLMVLFASASCVNTFP